MKKKFKFGLLLASAVLLMVVTAEAQQAGGYHIAKSFPVAGDGGWDYIAVGPGNNRLYVSHGTQVNVLDEKTGDWLKGEERSRYYNHSTFNDLIITGLVGLRPRADNIVEVNPLVPAGKWDWFCLDNVLYHGKILTIIWDKTGKKYKKGQGLAVWMDGKKVATAKTLTKLTGKL